MKNFITNIKSRVFVIFLPRKKFRTRVSHFGNAKYTVDYTNHRFIPKWTSLCFWFEQGHPGGTECWTTDLWSYKEAERIAESIKSMEDLHKYYEPLKNKEQKWRKDEADYWKENAPYKSKIINDK